MEYTTKQKIRTACYEDLPAEFRGLKTTVIDKSHSGDNHSYEIKANTILQTNYRTMPIYGSAHVEVPNKIIILGDCFDLSFLDSL